MFYKCKKIKSKTLLLMCMWQYIVGNVRVSAIYFEMFQKYKIHGWIQSCLDECDKVNILKC